MRPRRRIRSNSLEKGFSLAEALVALAVASVTILLLSSASFGLRQAADRAAQDGVRSTDWLTARRALGAWTMALTAPPGSADAHFQGSATRARMVIPPFGEGSGGSHLAELEVVISDEGQSLIARRHPGSRDVRMVSEAPRVSHILTAPGAIRLVYLMDRRDAPGQVWRYDGTPGDDLPHAIGIELGTDRIVTAKVPVTRSAACVAREGIAGLEGRSCRIR